jgi:hypothetical protein
MVRIQLSTVMQAVISQLLIPRIDKPGRVAVFEIMVNTPSIAALIRDNKTFRIQSDIQTGAKYGMVTLDSFLIEKYLQGMIAREEVVTKAQDPTTIQAKLQELELAQAAANSPAKKNNFFNMAEEFQIRLLSLIKEQGLIDDLQYEEVVGELKRSGAPVIQVLQDFGIMKLDDILHVMAGHIGHGGGLAADREFRPELLQTIPAKVAQMYHCLPVAMNNGTLQVALADPLDPARADEIHFAAKRDVQIVVADPAEIEKAIEKLYGQEEARAFSEILKELGADKDIAREVSEAATTTRNSLMARWPTRRPS